MIDLSRYVRLTLDPVRLALLGSAARGSVDVAAVADDLGVAARRVAAELAALVEAGLIADGRLQVETLRSVARALPRGVPVAGEILEGPWNPAEMKVLRTFFGGDRLTSIPSVRGKRRIVLERLAMEFEPGRRYSEREVDFTLQLFHPDHAALRRYLVDEGLMTRAEGVYWRTGGRYEPISVADEIACGEGGTR